MNINKEDAQGFLNVLNVLTKEGPGQFAMTCDESTSIMINVLPNGSMGIARVATIMITEGN